MKIVLQRVHSALVRVDDKVVGEIKKGYVIFLGFLKGDTLDMVEKTVDKIFRLRIFADSEGKTNLSASQVDGEILVVSQFTLASQLTQNRPSFSNALEKELAYEYYLHFVNLCKEKNLKRDWLHLQCGAHMEVFVHNDGPFTLVIEG